MEGSRFSALRHPAFRRYWLASFASVGATQLQIMGQGWLIYELTESSLMLGYLGAAAAIPAIVMTLFGGAMADRFDKRKLLAITSVLTAALLGTLCLLDATALVTAWHVIVIAALVSLIQGVDWPARQAIFPLLIERSDMMSAVALSSLIWQSTRMVLPAAGGLLIALFDTWLLFALCALGFVVMAIVMMTLGVETKPQAQEAHQSTYQQVREGITFILNNNLFLILFLMSYTGMFFVSSYMQLMPAFSALLGAGETGYGYLMSVSGLGSIIGTVLVSNWQRSTQLGVVMLTTAFLSGLFVYSFGIATAGLVPQVFVVALASVFAIALFNSMFMIASMTVLQLKVPEALRGRVMGLHGITYSLMPLGGLFTGALAALLSEPAGVMISATIYLVVIVVIAARQSDIRRIDGSAAA